MDEQHFTSANLVDKVCYKYSGSSSVAQASFMSDSVLVTVPHGLGFAPHCIGIYSDSANFEPSYEFDQPPYALVPAMGLYGPDFEASVKSDATNIYIQLRNWRSTRTMYYRVVGLIPYDVTDAQALPQSERDGTLLDSQDNFLKIHMQSSQNVALGSFSDSSFTVNHNLGYRPMVVGYTQLPSTDLFSPLRTFRTGTENSFGVEGLSSKLTVNESSFTFLVSTVPAQTIKCFYKVYLDA